VWPAGSGTYYAGGGAASSYSNGAGGFGTTNNKAEGTINTNLENNINISKSGEGTNLEGFYCVRRVVDADNS
jgi:hypothetical protein